MGWAVVFTPLVPAPLPAVGARRAGLNSLFSPGSAASREELSSVPLVTSKFSHVIVLCLLALLAFG